MSHPREQDRMHKFLQDPTSVPLCPSITGRVRAGDAGSQAAFDARIDTPDPKQNEDARLLHSQNVKVQSLIVGLRGDRDAKQFKSKLIAQEGKGALKIKSKCQVIWCKGMFKLQLIKIDEKKKLLVQLLL